MDAKRFWAQYSIRKALKTLSYWRNEIISGRNDDDCLESYSMWYAFLEDERIKAGVPPRKRQGERGKDVRPRKRCERPRQPKPPQAPQTQKIHVLVPIGWVPTELRWD